MLDKYTKKTTKVNAESRFEISKQGLSQEAVNKFEIPTFFPKDFNKIHFSQEPVQQVIDLLKSKTITLGKTPKDQEIAEELTKYFGDKEGHHFGPM